MQPMREAPRDGTHFLALERIGVDGTPDEVLEWREVWFEPKKWFLGGQSTWLAQAGETQFGDDCFVGWLPLPPKTFEAGSASRQLAANARSRVAHYEAMLEQCVDGVHWPSGLKRQEIAEKLQEARRMSSGRDADVRREDSEA